MGRGCRRVPPRTRTLPLPVPGAAAVIKVSIGANHPQAWWIRSIAEEMPEKCVAEEAPGLGPWVEEASELEVEN